MLAAGTYLFLSLAFPLREFLTLFVLLIGLGAYALFKAFGISEKMVSQLGGYKLLGGEKASHTQIASIASVFLVLALAWAGYAAGSAMFTAVFAGAIGGLVHEIAQSNGQFMLPYDDGKGNYYLGGLFGLVAGGVAGLLLTQGLGAAAVSEALVSEAFLAGLGLKGFADAVAAKRPDSS